MNTDRSTEAESSAKHFAFDAIAVLLIAGALVALMVRWKPWQPPAVQPPKRVAWTTSRVIGTPEPPPPFELHRIFPKLHFHEPLDITMVPGTDRVAVVEQYGKIYTFPNKQDVAKPDLLIDLKSAISLWNKKKDYQGDQSYGIAFHPKFKENHYVYICYVLTAGEAKPGSRVSRFTVSAADPPKIDPASEKILVTWPVGGHNGGCIKFGRDGDLYISTGDQANPAPPDEFNVGQNIGDLRSKILRIDVDHPSGDKPYGIPQDNPFVSTAGARPEVWCYGLRNPWRMNFDRATGRLWIGDVGWELWESVICATAGGNYGWSIMEGPNPIHPDGKRGPTPIIPPLLALSHAEAASLTGGTVYRGKKFPDLVGHYICGDWETRRIWDAELEGEDKLKEGHRTIAETDARIVDFGEDPDGELFILDHNQQDGGIYELARNPAVAEGSKFPLKLSQTGLFQSVQEQKPAEGVIPFSINAPQWLDGATAERFAAIPNMGSVTWTNDGKHAYPQGSVLVRTISLPMSSGDVSSLRKIETQILQFDGHKWHAYGYKWNDEQTDANLVKADGEDQEFTIKDWTAPAGERKQTWHYSSRAQCMTCHNSWSDYTLAFTDPQLDRDQRYDDGVTRNQLSLLRDSFHLLPQPHASPKRDEDQARQYTLVNPYDPTAPLEERVRSYLAVNCSHCHRDGGGGSALFDVRKELPLEKTKLVNTPAMLGSFGIDPARIIYAGAPAHSVLLYRISKTGVGRMPHIGSLVVDDRWVAMMSQWIAGLGEQDHLALSAPTVSEPQQEQSALHALARDDVDPSAVQRATDELLKTTSGALSLILGLENGQVAGEHRSEIIAEAAKNKQQFVHDLFERFPLAAEEGPKLGQEVSQAPLGQTIDDAKMKEILLVRGDAARGKKVFATAACVTCHFAADIQQRDFGPNLSHIGSKYDKAALLDNIVNPSKTIAEGFMPYVIKKKNASAIMSVLLVSQNNNEVVVKDQTAQTNEPIHIPRSEIQGMKVSTGDDGKPLSPMPVGVLAPLNMQQVADLLEFLHSMK